MKYIHLKVKIKLGEKNFDTYNNRDIKQFNGSDILEEFDNMEKQVFSKIKEILENYNIKYNDIDDNIISNLDGHDYVDMSELDYFSSDGYIDISIDDDVILSEDLIYDLTDDLAFYIDEDFECYVCNYSSDYSYYEDLSISASVVCDSFNDLFYNTKHYSREIDSCFYKFYRNFKKDVSDEKFADWPKLDVFDKISKLMYNIELNKIYHVKFELSDKDLDYRYKLTHLDELLKEPYIFVNLYRDSINLANYKSFRQFEKGLQALGLKTYNFEDGVLNNLFKKLKSNDKYIEYFNFVRELKAAPIQLDFTFKIDESENIETELITSFNNKIRHYK